MPVYDKIHVTSFNSFPQFYIQKDPYDPYIMPLTPHFEELACSVKIPQWSKKEGEFFDVLIDEYIYYIQRPLGTYIGDILYFLIPDSGDTIETIYYVHYSQ